jgi:Acetyltransferase (GNAT) domain
MSGAWECRPYRAGDEQGILDLYREVFRLDLTPEYWRWAFQDSPDGPAVIAVIELGHRIVGHYEVTPKVFGVDRTGCTAGYAGGTMLAPQVRNVTSFVEMAKMAYRLCRDRGISWLYCCPNEAALPVRTKLLEWRQLPDIVEWEGPLPPVGKRESKINIWRRWPDSLSLAEIPTAGAASVYSQRTAAWVQWRYFDRPGAEYMLHTVDDGKRATGFAVTKRYNRDGVLYGHIIDWQLQSGEAVETAELLNAVWQHLASWNIQRVSCWADGNSLLEHALSQAGLSPSGRKSHLCYYDLEGRWEQNLADRNAWQIVMADCDVY